MFLIALFRVKTANLAEARNRICGRSANWFTLQTTPTLLPQLWTQLLWDCQSDCGNAKHPWTLGAKLGSHERGSLGKPHSTFWLWALFLCKVAFSILWWMLDLKGNSNTDERIELLQEVTTLFPERKIAYLTAEREFLGHDWKGYLLKQRADSHSSQWLLEQWTATLEGKCRL